MKRIISLCLSTCFLCCLQHHTNGQQARLEREIGKIIRFDSNIDFSIVPGVLVGVIDGDSTFVSAFGEVLDPDSLYELGSVTKPFTVWLVEKALDALQWQIDNSICKSLPDSLCSKEYILLTFDQVLKHRSGLPRFPSNIGEFEDSMNDPYAFYDETHLANDLQQFDPNPNSYSYSQLAYASMYWLFDKVGGLDKFSRLQFVQQLGLRNTLYMTDDVSVAQGYGMDGRPKQPWHPGILSPAIGLKSSVYDVLSFIRSISPALASKNIASYKTQKKEIDKLSKKDEFKVDNGWFVIQSGSSIVYFLNGRTGGHHVSVAFIPEAMKAVVVITNSALGSNDLSLHVLRMINQSKE